MSYVLILKTASESDPRVWCFWILLSCLKEHSEKRKTMQKMGRERSELFNKERYARYMLVSM